MIYADKKYDNFKLELEGLYMVGELEKRNRANSKFIMTDSIKIFLNFHELKKPNSAFNQFETKFQTSYGEYYDVTVMNWKNSYKETIQIVLFTKDAKALLAHGQNKPVVET